MTQRDRSFNAFVADLNRFKLLTLDEEYELGIRKNNGDDKAFEQLVNCNLRFVISIAKKYYKPGNFSLMDLVAEGSIGLREAVKRFDPTKGFKLISYAVWYIRIAIWEFIAKNRMTVHIPSHIRRYFDMAKKQASIQSQLEGRDVPAYEIMLRDYPEFANWILDETIGLESESEEEFSLIDCIEDDSTEAPDSLVMNAALSQAIKEAMKDFSQMEKDLINYSFGLEGTYLNLSEVGELYCKRKEWMSILKQRTLRKLRFNEELREHYQN